MRSWRVPGRSARAVAPFKREIKERRLSSTPKNINRTLGLGKVIVVLHYAFLFFFFISLLIFVVDFEPATRNNAI